MWRFIFPMMGQAEAPRTYPTSFLVTEADPAPLVTEADTDE